MSTIHKLQNEIANLNTDARRALARDILAAQAQRLDDSLIPLNADHKKAMQKEKDERTMALVLCTAAAVGICALTAWCIVKGKKKVKEAAAKEKARLEEEKKELYRRMAGLKGRH